MLKLILFVLPLGFDTFAVSAARRHAEAGAVEGEPAVVVVRDGDAGRWAAARARPRWGDGRLGSRLGEAAREWAERFAGIAPIGLGILILAEKLVT